MKDLQLNTKGCSLNAIREKYKHEKVSMHVLSLALLKKRGMDIITYYIDFCFMQQFNCVANLSPKPVQSLF